MSEFAKLLDPDVLTNAAIADAAANTIKRIYTEIKFGNGFHMVLLDELEDILAKAGRHPVKGYRPSHLRDHAPRGDSEREGIQEAQDGQLAEGQ